MLDSNQRMLVCCAWVAKSWTCCLDTLANQRQAVVGNAETEHCFSCQNHRDVLVDGDLPVRDGEECKDGTLFQLPEPQRCTG